MSRSWRELRILFFIALPLLCALRMTERIQLLFLTPISVERYIFGRVVTQPWQLRYFDYFMNPEVYRYWTFAVDDIPEPLRRCVRQPPPAETDFLAACAFPGRDGGDFSAEWGRGRLRIAETYTGPVQ